MHYGFTAVAAKMPITHNIIILEIHFQVALIATIRMRARSQSEQSEGLL